MSLPKEHPDNKHAYYIYVVAHERRDNILSELAKKDIHLNISYPWPIHIMDAYKHFVCSSCNCLINTEKMSKKIFSLPMYPTLTDEEQKNCYKKRIKNFDQLKLKLNKKVPNFKLPSTSGDIFEISKVKRNIILYVYPKNNTLDVL